MKIRIGKKFPKKKKAKEDYWASLKKKPRKKQPKKRKQVKFIPKWKSYKEYLKSPEWKKLRELVLKRADNNCEICKAKKAWQVHHKTYKRIFRERLTDLIAVCGTCHREEHNLLNEQELEKAVNDLMKSEGYK